MTISSQTRTAGPFIGNGVTTVFPFSFKIFQATDLFLVRTDPATGISTTLVLTTDYTVVLNVDQNVSPGGNVTLTTPLGTPLSLVMTSTLAYLQSTDLTNSGGFYPKVITDALDRLTIFSQQLFGLTSRALRLPLSDVSIGAELPNSVTRANNLLGFDASGNPIAVAPVAGTATALSAALIAPTGSTLVSGTWFGGVVSTISALASSIGTSLLGFIQAGTGAVARSAQAKLRDSLSVKDFGALGTGGDDTAAFNAALLYASAAGIKTVTIPRGNFGILTPVAIPDGVSLVGEGKSSSTIFFSGTGAFTFTGTTLVDIGTCSLSRIGFTNQGAGSPVAITMLYTKRISFIDCLFYNISMSLRAFHYITFLACDAFGGTLAADHPTVNGVSESLKLALFNGSGFNVSVSMTTDVELLEMHLLGPTAQLSISAGSEPVGFYPLVFLNDVVVDSGDNEGIILSGVSFKAKGVWVSSGRTNLKEGIKIFNCVESSLAASTARYCGSSGITVTSCNSLSLFGNSFNDNKTAGMSMSACSNLKIIGNEMRNAPSWYGGSYVQPIGITDTGANCVNTLFAYNDCSGNTTTNANLPTAGTIIKGNIGIADSQNLVGTTAQRPTATVNNNYQYFDVTLNKPIWRIGSGWVDATGTTV